MGCAAAANGIRAGVYAVPLPPPPKLARAPLVAGPLPLDLRLPLPSTLLVGDKAPADTAVSEVAGSRVGDAVAAPRVAPALENAADSERSAARALRTSIGAFLEAAALSPRADAEPLGVELLPDASCAAANDCVGISCAPPRLDSDGTTEDSDIFPTSTSSSPRASTRVAAAAALARVANPHWREETAAAAALTLLFLRRDGPTPTPDA